MLSDEVLNNLVAKQSDESNASYAGFCAYARLPTKDRPFERSLELLMRLTGLAESTIRHYFKVNHWSARASQVDAYLLKADIQARHEANNELNLKYIEENRANKEKLIRNNAKAIDLYSKLLDYTLLANEEKVVAYAEDKDGVTIPIKTEVKMNFKVTDIASIVGAIEKGNRIVSEIPTEIINNRIVSDKDIDGLESFDELDSLEDEINREIQTIQTNGVS